MSAVRTSQPPAAACCRQSAAASRCPPPACLHALPGVHPPHLDAPLPRLHVRAVGYVCVHQLLGQQVAPALDPQLVGTGQLQGRGREGGQGEGEGRHREESVARGGNWAPQPQPPWRGAQVTQQPRPAQATQALPAELAALASPGGQAPAARYCPLPSAAAAGPASAAPAGGTG